MIEKYRKENDDLKSKIDRLESERESAVGSKRSLNTYKAEESLEDKSTVLRQSGKASKKVEEEEVSYKDIKKAKEAKEMKEPVGKVKYEYSEE